MIERHYASIASVSGLIRQKEISPMALVHECLQRIEQLNPRLNAFITVTSEQALESAHIAEEEITRGKWRGPLHGIPVGIKDMFDTAGLRTTAAFEHFRNRVPTKDAVSVTRLKQAGAIVLGKLNMHELAMGTTSAVSCFGSVHNPWHLDYVPGGSSGGSAAAVAAGLCFATLDTDAIGSCRLPAACCGVVGFKPSYGQVSLQGVLDGEPVDNVIVKLAHSGVMCRSAGDVLILMRVLADGGPDKADWDAAPGLPLKDAIRIGVSENFEAADDVRAAFSKSVETLRALNHPMIHVNVPFDTATFNTSHITRDRQRIEESLFDKVDVLVLPTLTDTPPTVAQAKARGPQAVSPANTFFGNYYGLPAISVPCGFSKQGLPLGLQIMAAPGRDAMVLKMAGVFQQATTWSQQHPNL